MKTKINLLGYYLFKLIWGLKYASLSWLQIIKKKKMYETQFHISTWCVDHFIISFV